MRHFAEDKSFSKEATAKNGTVPGYDCRSRFPIWFSILIPDFGPINKAMGGFVPTDALTEIWWRRHSYAWRLAGVFLYVMLCILCIGNAERTTGGSNIIWLANGLVLAFLLLVPRWRWTSYVAVAFAAMVLSSLFIG